MKLPVLNIANYSCDRSKFVQELRSACHTVGFFFLRHDVPIGLVKRQLHESRLFFQQSQDQKMEISYENNPSFRGYMKLGVENTGGQVDWREQVEWAVVEDPPTISNKNSVTRTTTAPTTAAATATATAATVSNESEHQPKALAPYYERLRAHENPWPQQLPSLRESTMEYVHHVCRIAECLRKALCLGLGLDEDHLSPLFYPPGDQPHWVIKLISYPPIISAPTTTSSTFEGQIDPESCFGVGPHTDTNVLTLVLQDDVVGGLQVFSKGEWINVPPDPSLEYLVVNLGEQAELFSRGYFLATPHRVLANVHQSVDRISVPLFYNPALSSTIRPIDAIPESVPWERPNEYDQEEHWRMKSNRMMNSVGENTFKSLARSHPEVFARHHPDLTLLPDGQMIQH